MSIIFGLSGLQACELHGLTFYYQSKETYRKPKESKHLMILEMENTSIYWPLILLQGVNNSIYSKAWTSKTFKPL